MPLAHPDSLGVTRAPVCLTGDNNQDVPLKGDKPNAGLPVPPLGPGPAAERLTPRKSRSATLSTKWQLWG